MKAFFDTSLPDRRASSNLGGQWVPWLFIWPLLIAGAASARPCYPSDPTAMNPGNLCPLFPPLGMSINSNSFMQGSATQGFYGQPLSPRIPGQPVGITSGKDGYWTQINNSSGTSIMRTNTGKSFTMTSGQ
jgi:hypothetical protein